MAHGEHDPTKGVPIGRMHDPLTVSQCGLTLSHATGPDRHLVARCLAYRCGVVEPFDVRQLACNQRALPLEAIGPKLRCRCGSRQVRLEIWHEPPEVHFNQWIILWHD